MAHKWTDEQLRVINDRDSNNHLVSAGAGSGKTAVLAERIYQLVRSGTPINSFLVLTFTNLAAAQMKSRIKKNLLSDPLTKEIAQQIDNSHIETFDSFALYIVKRFHDVVGLSKEINIIDQSILEIKKNIILEQLIEEYSQKDPVFAKIISLFCVKNTKNVKELILGTVTRGELEIDKNEFYKNYVSSKYNEDFILNLINDYYLSSINIIKETISEVMTLKSEDDVDNLLEYLNNLLTAKKYDELYVLLNSSNIPNKPKGSDDSVGERNAILARIKNLLKNAKDKDDFGDSKTIVSNFLSNKIYADKILEIAKKLDDKICEFKLLKNCFSFNDIQIFALNILNTNKEALSLLRSTFRNILVDEYQDTSDVQEAVLNLLDDNNIYIIGDIKQSIYRFRYANCNIFQDKFNNYKNGVGGIKIDLNKSFRSRKEIVAGVNDMFEILMNEKFGVIDYKEGHKFEFGQKLYEENMPSNQNYEIEVYKYNLNQSENKAIKEASIIADDIIKKYNSKFQIFDVGLGTLRDCEFSDFAIIGRTYKHFNVFKRVFTTKGIPIELVMDNDIRENDVLFVIKNFIKLLNLCLNSDYDNVQFAHSFMSIARSFLISMSDKDIYSVIKNKQFLTVPFMQQIELVKEELRFASLEEIVKKFMEMFDVDTKIMTIGNYRENFSMFEMIIKIAANMDLMQYSLEEFAHYFDDISKYDIKLKVDESGDASNAVKLINIHKSKGLEYQVCYYFDLDSNFNFGNTRSAMIATKELGLLLPNTYTNHTSLPISLFKRFEKAEIIAECIRLYYVALTRAKEKIILLSKINDKKSNIHSLLDAKSFEDFNNYANTLSNFIEADDTNTKLVVRKKEVGSDISFTLSNPQEIPYVKKEIKQASKMITEEGIEDLLLFGTRMHYLLEILDYETGDTSFIKDEKEVKYINNVLKCDLFKNVKNSEILHEYKYFDEKNNVNGVIDCIINKQDRVYIVDFKLKNILDEEYDKQLNLYKNYIQQITTKPIYTYLLSIIDGDIREVK